MVLNSLAAIALIPAAYSFPLDRKLTYRVEVAFNGFIPLLGGQEGAVQANLDYEVQGLEPDQDGNKRAAGDITGFELTYNGTLFPLTLDNVKAYFPKTTIAYSPRGKVLKTDAPDTDLPVRLPGLDIKRFPDVTYMPLELPEEGLEVGRRWTYSKPFGDSEVAYDVTATNIEGDRVDLDVALAQRYEVLENAGYQVVKEERDAEYRVSTDMKGKGTAVFDAKLGAVREFKVDADATSVEVNLKTGAKRERKLKTKLTVTLKDP